MARGWHILGWKQLLLLAIGFWSAGVFGQDNPLLMGSVAMDVPSVMVSRLTPLTRYLSDKIGKKVVFQVSPNLESAVYDLGAGRTQIAYLTPVAYIEAHEKFGVLPLAAPLTHGKETFRLVIVVKQDSNIRHVKDLKGKKFALGDEKALLQQAVVCGGGIKLTDLGAYAFLKHYDTIAKAVLRGDFDAGILKDTVAEEYGKLGLRVIHSSPPLSSYLFAVNAKVPKQTVTLLRNAMLSLKPDTPEGRAVLSALDEGYDGFAESTDEKYDSIRKLIAPFRKK